MKFTIFIFGVILGGLFADVTHPCRVLGITYTVPDMTDYERDDLEFFKAMKELR